MHAVFYGRLVNCDLTLSVAVLVVVLSVVLVAVLVVAQVTVTVAVTVAVLVEGPDRVGAIDANSASV